MSEIEKLYKNSGVKKIELDYPDNYEPFYPEFTEEKQLNIIKWLMKNRKDYQYDTYNNTYWFIIDDDRECKKYRKFDEALAELMNLYWQDFTVEEKKEIKRILK